jgi:glutamate racemase
MIIVACNSASSLGIDAVRREIKLPVLGVIGPGARTALKNTKNKNIGVIGTRATINSGAYQKALKDNGNNLHIFAVPTPLFVPLVEEGWSDSPITKEVAEEYLKDLKLNEIDTLILGCTHYPFLKKVISSVMGADVILVDSADALAGEALQTLQKNGQLNNSGSKGSIQYFTTDSPSIFKETGERLIDLDLSDTKQMIF